MPDESPSSRPRKSTDGSAASNAGNDQVPSRSTVPLEAPDSLDDLEQAVVTAVAEAAAVDPLELPPVGDVADLEALARFYASLPRDAREDSRVSFRVRDVHVTVADGRVMAVHSTED